jgi:carbamoyl-phosphate synthase large subunit
MALSSRFAGRTSSLLRQVRAPASPARAFTTRAATRCLYARSQTPAGKITRYVRLFSNSTLRGDQTQTAPSAKAYLESGVVKGAANPVNVKKVLVIGSGGLSIGQAGEFDYSGWCSWSYPFGGMSHLVHKFMEKTISVNGRSICSIVVANIFLPQDPRL